MRTRNLISNVKLLRNIANWNKVVMPNIAEEENEAGTERALGAAGTLEDVDVAVASRPLNVKQRF